MASLTCVRCGLVKPRIGKAAKLCEDCNKNFHRTRRNEHGQERNREKTDKE